MASSTLAQPLASLLRAGTLRSSPASVCSVFERQIRSPFNQLSVIRRAPQSRSPISFVGLPSFGKPSLPNLFTSHSRRTFFSPSHSVMRSVPMAVLGRDLSTKADAVQTEQEKKRKEEEDEDEDPVEATKKQKMGDRLKYLMKKYGWAAVGVYLFYSAIDFALVFAAINLIGADQVRQAEDWFLERVDWKAYTEGWSEEKRSRIPGVLDKFGTRIHEYSERHHQETKDKLAQAHTLEEGKLEAGHSSLWTTAILAYTIHKTLLLPFRLGLTAGTLPQIVKQLQRWGYNVGRGAEKKTAAGALLAVSNGSSRRGQLEGQGRD